MSGRHGNIPRASEPAWLRTSVLARRIVTDLPIPQLSWWSNIVEVLHWPSHGGLLGALVAALRTVRLSWSADAFIGSTLRNTLALGLFKRLTGRARPVIVLTETRLDDPLPGWRWRFKVAVQRYAFQAVDLVCVSARKEGEAYARRLGLPVDRFRFVPWHTNVLTPRVVPAIGCYVFAAGRTGRDWRTLAAAVSGLDLPVTVVCSPEDAATIGFSANVNVSSDVPYATYRQLLEGASIVVVPLEPHVYSSGQVVILEAMAMGKAVVVTRAVGSEDYVEDEIDGLLVEQGDATGMRAALLRLHRDHSLRLALGEAALTKVLHRHTLEYYASHLLQIVEQVTACSHAAVGRRSGR